MTPDPIIARIADEPGVQEVSFPGESSQRNFYLEDGPHRLTVYYQPGQFIQMKYGIDPATAETFGPLLDQTAGDPLTILAALEAALAWLHGGKAETWRHRPGML